MCAESFSALKTACTPVIRYVKQCLTSKTHDGTFDKQRAAAAAQLHFPDAFRNPTNCTICHDAAATAAVCAGKPGHMLKKPAKQPLMKATLDFIRGQGGCSAAASQVLQQGVHPEYGLLPLHIVLGSGTLVLQHEQATTVGNAK